MTSANAMHNDNAFKLGIFSPNCSGGMAVTKVPESWDASWDQNLELAKMADRAGIEFLLPIARWTGYGGDTDFQGQSLETITWAAGLLAATENISVFATAHTAFTHPLVAAKQFATIDHISHGRFGLNIVCGWNQPEYEMFGIEMPNEHDVRYGLGQEWWDVIKTVWGSDEPQDWDGDYFKLQNAVCSPKPVDGTFPPIMNAGSSEQGRDFAARNCDFLFTVMVDTDMGAADVSAIKTLAKEKYQRDIGVFTTSYVVCRPTNDEAQEYHKHYAEDNADWEAVDRLMTLQGMYAQSFPADMIEGLRVQFAGGHGVYPLIGDPDHVADEIERIHTAGFSGCTVSFVDYAAELPYFVQEVIPRLEAKGLRVPPPSQDGASIDLTESSQTTT